MKKLIVLFVGIVAVVSIIALTNTKHEDYLRLHIRANSNSEYDQNIKYEVKDTIVKELTNLTLGITSKSEMMDTLNQNLSYLEYVVDEMLKEKGVTYRSNIELIEENFPTRSYEEITLGAGVYDALIIELGSGKGDNWWCVAFPPLCFVTSDSEDESVEYKSIIKEWIDKILNKN